MEQLNFQGEFYKLTLMTPFFSPEPHEYYRIPVTSPASIGACASSPANYVRGFTFTRCTPAAIAGNSHTQYSTRFDYRRSRS